MDEPEEEYEGGEITGYAMPGPGPAGNQFVLYLYSFNWHNLSIAQLQISTIHTIRIINRSIITTLWTKRKSTVIYYFYLSYSFTYYGKI